ncbi:hypothetical protein CBD41_07850 [bacterium TMED181]|nr:hypothetical protein [Planctomycetota bacterium]OUW43074.1 MAG: hypothetical protein CBD41_07850 [bacterium TMED181]
MSVRNGCYGFHLTFRVPNDEVSRVDEFFETHQSFMRETHHLDGDIEPVVLTYAVMRGPEMNDPLNPESGETGHTLFGITEIYRGSEGCQAHMALGQSREAMFSDLMGLTQDYMVGGLLGARVEYSMQA